MKPILLILILFFAGCNPAKYTGEIKVYDANNVLQERYVAETNKPALIEAGGVKLDGRASGFGDFVKGLIQIATLGILAKD